LADLLLAKALLWYKCHGQSRTAFQPTKGSARVKAAKLTALMVGGAVVLALAGCGAKTSEPSTPSENRAAQQSKTAEALAAYGYDANGVSENDGKTDSFVPHEPFWVFTLNKKRCDDTDAYSCDQLAHQVMVSQDQSARVIRVHGSGDTVYCKVPDEWQDFPKLEGSQRVELLSAPGVIHDKIGNSDLDKVRQVFVAFHLNPGPGGLDWACVRDDS
jgi:hypothetical protein